MAQLRIAALYEKHEMWSESAAAYKTAIQLNPSNTAALAGFKRVHNHIAADPALGQVTFHGHVIDISGRPARGSAQPTVTIVVFDDFQCPFCSRFYQTMFPFVLNAYPQTVRVVLKDYPLDIHRWAMHAAVDANCLAAQSSAAYWAFADYVHTHRTEITGAGGEIALRNLDRLASDVAHTLNLSPEPVTACIQAQNDTGVRHSIDEGGQLKVDGTPTIFINGQEYEGAIDESQLKAAIEAALVAR